jgi:hypothetical protein
MTTGPCRVNASGQIMHEPCGWTTDVQGTGNAVRCCKCGSRFEWRDGHFFPATPVNPALAGRSTSRKQHHGPEPWV